MADQVPGADANGAFQHDMRLNDRAFPENYVISDDRERTDLHVVADACSSGHDR